MAGRQPEPVNLWRWSTLRRNSPGELPISPDPAPEEASPKKVTRPRRMPRAATLLRKQPPSDRLSRVGLLVCELLLLLGIAGAVLIIRVLISPVQLATSDMYFMSGVMLLLLGMGAGLSLFLHVRVIYRERREEEAVCQSGEEPRASSPPAEEAPTRLPSLQTLRRTDPSRLQRLRMASSERVRNTINPRHLSKAEYLACLLMAGLGGYSLLAMVLFAVDPPEVMDSRSVLGAFVMMAVGSMSLLRLLAFHRAASKGSAPAEEELPSPAPRGLGEELQASDATAAPPFAGTVSSEPAEEPPGGGPPPSPSPLQPASPPNA